MGFFSLYTVIVFAGVLGVSIFMDDEMSIVLFLQILMWMQLFMIGSGRGLLELYSHFIYGVIVALLILFVWQLVDGALCFLLSKNVLHNCDMQVMKPAGK